jgi:hypothetical protein
VRVPSRSRCTLTLPSPTPAILSRFPARFHPALSGEGKRCERLVRLKRGESGCSPWLLRRKEATKALSRRRSTACKTGAGPACQAGCACFRSASALMGAKQEREAWRICSEARRSAHPALERSRQRRRKNSKVCSCCLVGYQRYGQVFLLGTRWLLRREMRGPVFRHRALPPQRSADEPCPALALRPEGEARASVVRLSENSCALYSAAHRLVILSSVGPSDPRLKSRVCGGPSIKRVDSLALLWH